VPEISAPAKIPRSAWNDNGGKIKKYSFPKKKPLKPYPTRDLRVFIQALFTTAQSGRCDVECLYRCKGFTLKSAYDSVYLMSIEQGSSEWRFPWACQSVCEPLFELLLSEKSEREKKMMDTILWWHWIVLGVILIMLELALPSFTIFWFGLGALVTGLLLLMLPDMALKWQVLMFVVSSVGFTICWFYFFVPRKKVKSILLDEQAAIGQTGIAASRALIPGEKGRVVFSVPVLGEESWFYVADEPIETGNRLRVIAVALEPEERFLKVEKVR
jgi:membrane protein implicated in regulation of membrane protease activity